MSMTVKRLFGWWFLAEDAVRLLSAPRKDVARSDREVEQVFRESWLFTSGRAMRAKAMRAWADSRVVARTRPVGATLFPPDSTARVRVAGVIALVASITALILQTLEPTPLGPLTWIVPVVTAAAGAAIAFAAAPIARALEDKAHRA
jgi:hypothetical protein